MESYFHVLKSLAEQCGLPSIKQLAKQPDVKSVIRVTLHHGNDAAASDAIGTMIEHIGQIDYGVVYSGRFRHQPIRYERLPAAYQDVLQALRQTGFDQLLNQHDIPMHNAKFCLLERAAGGFEKGVLFALNPQSEPYSRLQNIVMNAFPEVLREL